MMRTNAMATSDGRPAALGRPRRTTPQPFGLDDHVTLAGDAGVRYEPTDYVPPSGLDPRFRFPCDAEAFDLGAE